MRTNRPILSTFAVGLAEAMKAIKQLPLHLAACFGFFLYLFEELVELSIDLKEGIAFNAASSDRRSAVPYLDWHTTPVRYECLPCLAHHDLADAASSKDRM